MPRIGKDKTSQEMVNPNKLRIVKTKNTVGKMWEFGAEESAVERRFGVFVGLTNVITYTKNGSKISISFSRPTGGKTRVSL